MSDFVCGLDLGKAQDYSALCCCERTPERDGSRYDARMLTRWNLGTPYTAIADDVCRAFGEPPLRGSVLVVDHSGVGSPLVDFLRQRSPRCSLVPVTITAGAAVTRDPDGLSWHVAKVPLISRLQLLLQRGRLRFAEGAEGTPALVDELLTYEVAITPAGNETFNARTGRNDDLVLALALAVWWGEQCPRLGPGSIGLSRPCLSGLPRGLFPKPPADLFGRPPPPPGW